MSQMLENAIRLQVMRVLGTHFTSKIGIVTDYRPAKFIVRVALQPEGTNTGYIPLASKWIGNGWGMYCAPSIGDKVIVHFIDGVAKAGIAENFIFDNGHIPQSVSSGEFWLIHKKGQLIKLQNDGSITLDDGQGASVRLDGTGKIASAGTWTHTGDIKVTGNQEVDGTQLVKGVAHFQGEVTADHSIQATTDVLGGGKSLKTHTHGGVSTGGGNTAPPN